MRITNRRRRLREPLSNGNAEVTRLIIRKGEGKPPDHKKRRRERKTKIIDERTRAQANFLKHQAARIIYAPILNYILYNIPARAARDHGL